MDVLLSLGVRELPVTLDEEGRAKVREALLKVMPVSEVDDLRLWNVLDTLKDGEVRRRMLLAASTTKARRFQVLLNPENSGSRIAPGSMISIPTTNGKPKIHWASGSQTLASLATHYRVSEAALRTANSRKPSRAVNVQWALGRQGWTRSVYLDKSRLNEWFSNDQDPVETDSQNWPRRRRQPLRA